MRTIVLCAASAALLTACAGGGGDTITALPRDIAANARVADVTVAVPADSSPELAAALQTRISGKLGACAMGSRPLNLQVTITEFHSGNAAATFLVGSSNNIRGSARLVDPATGAVVGDYEINRSVGGGGLIAMAAMANSQNQMGDAFGEEICNQAFPHR